MRDYDALLETRCGCRKWIKVYEAAPQIRVALPQRFSPCHARFDVDPIEMRVFELEGPRFFSHSTSELTEPDFLLYKERE